ncbi:hypothetical protein HELRODRAFT_164098 [Helobdella robusta]|uniref:Uncharacterized protein n=1 Tax=Helobdella robusta TaxID=6412 RepID=T1EUX4_HELRO|nr:hypothetical protein HELRODRAFT_164098 [Helobdella robusta]ESN94287.1 hypothetical protein HELRODRAFT_164098 [Helobdella robusta]
MSCFFTLAMNANNGLRGETITINFRKNIKRSDIENKKETVTQYSEASDIRSVILPTDNYISDRMFILPTDGYDCDTGVNCNAQDYHLDLTASNSSAFFSNSDNNHLNGNDVRDVNVDANVYSGQKLVTDDDSSFEINPPTCTWKKNLVLWF